MKERASTVIGLSFVDRINARDHIGLAELMTEDFRFIDYGGDCSAGRDRMRDGFREYFDAYPEYRILVQKVVVSGRDSVLIIGQTSGSHIRPEVENRETVVWKADIRGGLVCEWRIYADTDVVAGKAST